jgi:glycolate oxidase FAD binding subunit
VRDGWRPEAAASSRRRRYDVPKLHVGALGTLGVVVEATFKVRPRPEREVALRIECSEVDAAARALELRDAIEPQWLEIAGPGVLGSGAGVALLAGFLGSDAEVQASRTRAEQIASIGAREPRSSEGR